MDLKDVCDAFCACDPSYCDSSLQECYASVDEYTEQAISAGCLAELEALDACLGGYLCVDEPPDCLDPTSLAVDACIANDPQPPPPSSICDAAAVICGAAPEPAQCSGSVLCAATCIVQLDSCDLAGDPALEACLNDCG